MLSVDGSESERNFSTDYPFSSACSLSEFGPSVDISNTAFDRGGTIHNTKVCIQIRVICI